MQSFVLMKSAIAAEIFQPLPSGTLMAMGTLDQSDWLIRPTQPCWPGLLEARRSIVSQLLLAVSASQYLLKSVHFSWFDIASFSLWAPNVYQYYKSQLRKLYDELPHLETQKNFNGSIFPCATFNFGPNAWSFKHKDIRNCAFGWCAITALGTFDPTAGGHLILWDLKIVVEFPAASTIIIPSATLAHSNIPVLAGQTRMSFTQYCSGGLFRWVDNGFRTEKELAVQDPAEYKRLMALKPGRWEVGVALFSTFEQLLKPLVTNEAPLNN